jgi:site-specific recombinase XerD
MHEVAPTTARQDDTPPLGTAAECDRLARFLGELEERGRKPATIEAYRADWLSLARWFEDTNGQHFDLTPLAGMDLADYRSFLVRTAKPATVSRRLLFLRAYAGEAHRRHQCSDETWEHVRALRAPKAQPQAPRGLTAEEARAARTTPQHCSWASVAR